MNLDHLRYFVLTAETLHTTKAAKMANVGQSTICHGIRKLEENLGQDLFENLGRRIVLTESGKRFSLRAKELLAHAERLKNDFRSESMPLDGTLRIGATHGVSNILLAPLLGDLHMLHTGLVFETYSLRSAQVLEGIANKTLDLGICFSPTSHPEIQEVYRRKFNLVLAVKPGHALLKVKKSQLSQKVSMYPCASPKAFAGIEVCENHPALLKLGIRPEAKFIFDSYEVAGQFLLNSNATCLMPEILLKQLELKALPFEDLKATATMCLLIPRGRNLPQQIETAFKPLFS